MKNRLAQRSDERRDGRPAGPEAADEGALNRLISKAEQTIAAYPKATIGLGLALGVTLGWLIKRK